MTIICATDIEKRLIEPCVAPRWNIEGATVLVTGIGALNVGRVLSMLDKEEEIINVGYAGSNKFKIGTVVEIGKCGLHHPHVEYAEELSVLTDDSSVVCYSSTDFVTETNIDEPCVFDMELAFIKALGFKNLRSIKVVSDSLNYDEYCQSVS